MTAAAGTDATEAFDYVEHSSHAKRILKRLARPDLHVPPERRTLPGARRGGAQPATPALKRRRGFLQWWEEMGAWFESSLYTADDPAASRRHARAMGMLTGGR